MVATFESAQSPREAAPDDRDGASAVMALCQAQHLLGVACYDEATNCILVDSVHFALDDAESIINHLKMTLSPSMFLIHPNLVANSSMLEFIIQSLDGVPHAYSYKVLKSSTWNAKACRKAIHTSLKVASHSNVYDALASSVEMESTPMVQALGALIAHLQSTAFQLESGRVIVSELKAFPTDEFLRIDMNSLNALQVFAEDFHPNWIKEKGKSKEGFSLFALMDRTRSLPGREKLRDWMARPLCSAHALDQRHRGVAFVTSHENIDIILVVKTNLKHVHDLSKILLRIKKVTAKPADWCRLHTSLAAMVAILAALHLHMTGSSSSSSTDQKFIQDLLLDVDVETLNDLNYSLADWIDFESSAKEEEIVIQSGKDNVLDEKRELYEDLEGYLVQAAHQILQATPILECLSVEYVPQVGYLAVVSAEDMVRLKEQRCLQESLDPSLYSLSSPTTSFAVDSVGVDELFTFVFSQGPKNYFKHRVVNELDAKLGDLQSDIQDRQQLIMMQLEESLLELETEILRSMSVVATVDAYISLGIAATEFNLTKPQLVDEDVVVIKNGRHLLQQLVVDSFIPNDTLISTEKNVSLITGPNSSGKSVYLKQVGLIVYLAHIGSWVPCDHAVIGLTDKIFTRIRSQESASNPQSAFMLDLNQMGKMLKSKTSRSLCLIDEFGKGTNPLDGMALLAAIIQDMVLQKAKAIFVLHFVEILLNRIIDDNIMASVYCFRMETVSDNADDESDNDSDPYAQSVPIFKLKFGIGESSEGIECARKMGVHEAALTRAVEVKAAMLTSKPLEPMQSSVWIKPSHKDLMQLFLATDWDSADETTIDTLRALL